MYLQIEEHEKIEMEWNKRKQMKILNTKGKIKTLPISDALDSYGAFFKFQEVKPFGKLQFSFVVKIYTESLVP